MCRQSVSLSHNIISMQSSVDFYYSRLPTCGIYVLQYKLVRSRSWFLFPAQLLFLSPTSSILVELLSRMMNFRSNYSFLHSLRRCCSCPSSSKTSPHLCAQHIDTVSTRPWLRLLWRNYPLQVDSHDRLSSGSEYSVSAMCQCFLQKKLLAPMLCKAHPQHCSQYDASTCLVFRRFSGLYDESIDADCTKRKLSQTATRPKLGF